MNMKRILFGFFCILGGLMYLNVDAYAQENDPVLFTFGDETVTKSEFIYVYEKHNSQDKDQYSNESIDEYLRLYTNFKLKVKEAENQGIDTLSHISPQLDQYYKQLSKSYLYDKEVSGNLIREAYSRMTKEVSCSHILIRLDENASPQDTAVAYNKLADIRTKIVKGDDFRKMAVAHSQDPSVKDNKGNLGYITAFQTVYPFESAAYETQKGEISPIVRTKFGYHIVKAHDIRAAKGKLLTAHILVKSKSKDADEKKVAAKEKINQLYNQVTNGADFAERAKFQSEDKQTSNKGGELPWFGSGRMLPEYEKAAFDLKEIGGVSKPFKTRIGWHIVKLLEKDEVGSFEEEEAVIKKKIKRDSRSKVSKAVFLKRLKKDYSFKETSATLKPFKAEKHAAIIKGNWQIKNAVDLSDKMFTIEIPKVGTAEYTQQHFAKFIQKNQLKARSKTQEATINLLYKMFVEQSLLEVEEGRLIEKYPEFKRLLKEFRDGTLLFELTEQKVWNKALEDTTGLKEFHKQNKDNYMWAERVDAAIVTVKDPGMAKKVAKLLKKTSAGFDVLEKTFNKNGANVVEAKQGRYEKGQNELVDGMSQKVGVSAPINNQDGSLTYVKINKVLPPMTKELSEARGYIIADYQSELEKKWVDELRQKYPVKVNEEVLKSIYK